MHYKLNDPIAHNGQISVVVKAKELGIIVYLVVTKHSNGTGSVLSFFSREKALTVFNRVIRGLK